MCERDYERELASWSRNSLISEIILARHHIALLEGEVNAGRNLLVCDGMPRYEMPEYLNRQLINEWIKDRDEYTAARAAVGELSSEVEQ